MIEKAAIERHESGLDPIEKLEQIIHQTPDNPRERQRRIDELREVEHARIRGGKVISATENKRIITA